MKDPGHKILIIRFSSIGDIVLTTPVIRCLKLQLPQAEVHFLTKKAYHPVLKGNPYIDKFHLLSRDLSDLITELKVEKFSYIIDLHHNLRTKRIKLKLGIKAFSYNKLNVQKWLMVNFKLNLLPDVHIVDRYLQTAKALNIRNDGKGLDYFFEKEHSLSDILPSGFEQFIAIAIGAQHFTKRLPTYKFIEICRLAKVPVVLLGGQDDIKRGEEIALACDDSIYNACGKLTLDESAFVIKMSQRVISNDTGLMHIAAAFNKPVTSLWGNTIPEFGMYPYSPEPSSKIIENKELKCRPCSKIGYKKCPLGHFKCMEDLNTSDILAPAQLEPKND